MTKPIKDSRIEELHELAGTDLKAWKENITVQDYLGLWVRLNTAEAQLALADQVIEAARIVASPGSSAPRLGLWDALAAYDKARGEK